MSTPESNTPSSGAVPETNSFDAITVIIEGKPDSAEWVRPPILKIWAAYERDRLANPTTPRPYRPYLEPPPPPPPSPPESGTT